MAASLPRRRSPVRIWCSAPECPESARLAIPGFFMGVAFEAKSCVHNCWALRVARPNILGAYASLSFGDASAAWRLGTRVEHLRAGFQTAARQESVPRRIHNCRGELLFAGRAGLVARGTIANRERANALVQDAAMNSATRCLAGPKRKRVSVQRHCAARCTRRLRK
jgi:hypothetical protein